MMTSTHMISMPCSMKVYQVIQKVIRGHTYNMHELSKLLFLMETSQKTQFICILHYMMVQEMEKINEVSIKGNYCSATCSVITSQSYDFKDDMHKVSHGNVSAPTFYRCLIALLILRLCSALTCTELTSCFVCSLQVSAGHNDFGSSPGKVTSCLFTNTYDREGTII